MSLDKPEAKMPKPDPLTNRDELGIRYEGPVLSGQVGLNEHFERQAASLPIPSPIPPYQGRPTEPDPLYAYQRSQLPHPSLADPVIRCHLNLPPLPDPYEQQRKAAEAFENLKKEGKIKVYR